MENIPRDLTSVPDKETEQENISWYILTIVMRIGRPSLPEEISEKCTLFRVSPLEVEALCSIPQSPICITGGQTVTCSESAIFLFHKACGRQVLPFDLVVPDSPVNLSSPSTDSRKEFSTFVHGKPSCHTTSAMISPLTSKLHAPVVGTTNACTTSNLHRDFPVQPLMRHFAYFKEGDISSLKCHGKRSVEELFSTEINFRKSSKPRKILSSVGQSVIEHTRETNEHIWHLPDHTGGVDSNICRPKTRLESRDVPVFESFTVEQEEGSGGYGTVYKARRKQDGQIFAIKCPLEKTPKRYVTNEIKMLQRFGGKNFIIKSEGVLKNCEQDCLILKYVPHEKPEVLRREITMLELCWYGFCMFKALATLHKEGIIHRDVKPGNFLFSRKTRRGYLIDFNLAVDQYDTTSDKFGMLPLASRCSGPYAGQMHPLFNRKGNNDRSLAFRKQNMLHLQTESAMPYQSKKLSYSPKKATQVSTKPSSTQWKDREHAAVHGNERMKTTLVQPSISTDMRSHRKFGRDILNIDGKNKLGSSVQSKNIASGHTPSVGEAVREPLPTQGRKELLSLLQDVCNDSPQQPASFAVSQRKRVAAPQERVARDQNIVRVLSMPLSSNLNVLECGLNGLANGRDMRKGKRQGPCIGTKGYRAPEVLLRSSHQSPKLDVWSAGISLLYLMVGKSPFPANSTDQAIRDIAKMKGTKDIWELSKLHDRQSTLLQDLHSVGFEHITIQEWCKKNTKRPEFLDCIPMSLYDLVDKCLCVNPQRRLYAEEALNHEFFAHCCEEYEKWRSLREPLS